MNVSKRSALYLSILVISGYWVYQALTAASHRELPPEFSVFVGRVVLLKIIHLVAIFGLLRLEGANWDEMGVRWIGWKKQVLSGLLIGFIMFVLLNVMLSSVMSSIFHQETGSSASAIDLYLGRPLNLFILLLIGILGGGVVEELERIFVLTRLEKAWQKPGLYLALILSSIMFGVGHLYQGPALAVSTGISGLLLGLIYIRRRSAIEVITAHAFSDVLAMLAAYFLAGHIG